MTSDAPPALPRFARFQAMADLRAVARAMDAPAVARIAGRIPGPPGPEDLHRVLRCGDGLRDGLQDGGAALRACLMLAATLPQEDAAGFAGATALLLCDLLGDGAGAETLYWHYEAHRARYRMLPDAPRAAIMRGYDLVHRSGRVTLAAAPTPDEVTRAARPVVLRALAGVAPGAGSPAAEMVRVVERALAGRACAAARLWEERAAEVRALPAPLRQPVLAALRYLCEIDPGWDPYAAWGAERIAREGVAIPYGSD